MPKRKKKKGTDAWRNLLKVHKKGPKRVRINRPRKKNGIDPLTTEEHARKVQIIFKQSCGKDNSMCIHMFKESFHKIGLKEGCVQKMTEKQYTRAARDLEKTFGVFTHNDYLLTNIKEMKLETIGRCILITGKLRKPDATLHIEPVATSRIREHWQAYRPPPDVEVEYM